MNTHRAFRPNVTGGTNAYQDALHFLGTRDTRKIQNHTYLQKRDNSIAVKFWWTDVVTYNIDGSICLDTGGHHTVSTKERINHYNPLGGVGSEKGDWWYMDSSNSNELKNRLCYEFKNEMLINQYGVPNTRPRNLVLLERIVGKDLSESEAIDYVSGLELVQVKRLVRNKYLRDFTLAHCKKEYVPAFLENEDVSGAVADRLQNL